MPNKDVLVANLLLLYHQVIAEYSLFCHCQIQGCMAFVRGYYASVMATYACGGKKKVSGHMKYAIVGDFFYVDLFVEEEVIVELKSVQNLTKEHEVQLVNYLNGLKKDIGLLINFGPSGVQVQTQIQTTTIKRSWYPYAEGGLHFLPFIRKGKKSNKILPIPLILSNFLNKTQNIFYA